MDRVCSDVFGEFMSKFSSGGGFSISLGHRFMKGEKL